MRRRHHHHHHTRAIRGRFAGFHYVNPEGECIVATQTIPLNTPSTTQLVFTDDAGAVVSPGPVGSVSSSDSNVQVALSADGQSVNATLLTAGVSSTLTWNGIGANGPFTFSVDVTDAVAPPVTAATGGQFGTFGPGTTA